MQVHILPKHPQITQPTHTHTHKMSTLKGKAVPLQAWSGPVGSRKLRFPDYMTTAQDGGKFVSLKNRPPLSPGNAPGTHFC
jgi:predicted transcriptional regulator